MAMFKHLLILALAAFTLTVDAQLRGSNTESNAENLAASDETSLDAASMNGAEPVAVSMDAASTENLPAAVDGESEGVASLEIDSVKPEIDLFNTDAADIVGLEDIALDIESAGPVVTEEAGLFIAEPDVAIESNNDAEEFIGMADTAADAVVASVDLDADPQDDLNNPSFIINENAESFVLPDPTANVGSEGVEMESADDAEEFFVFPDAAAEAIIEPEAIVNDASPMSEEYADLAGMADTAVEDADPIALTETNVEPVALTDALSMDDLAAAVVAEPEWMGASVSVPEDLAFPTDVADLDVSEATLDALTEAATADFAAATEELARDDTEGMAFIDVGSAAEIETPIAATEPSAEEIAATLEGFEAADNSASGSMPANTETIDLPTEFTFANEEKEIEVPELFAETSFPNASIDAATTPELTEKNEPEFDFTGGANAAEIVEVGENKNRLVEGIDAELASLANTVEERLGLGVASTNVGTEAVVDDTVNELAGAFNSVTGESEIHSSIDDTRDAQPVEVAPAIELVMSSNEAAPLAEVPEASLGSIVTEASNAPDVASDAAYNVEDEVEAALNSEEYDHENHDHESHADGEEMEVMETLGSTSAAMHTYPSIYTLLVVAFTAAGVFF